MTDAHGKHVGAVMPALGNYVEETCKLPSGDRAHFILLVWTPDGVVQYVTNTSRGGCAQLMTQQVEVWAKGDVVLGPPT